MSCNKNLEPVSIKYIQSLILFHFIQLFFLFDFIHLFSFHSFDFI